MPKIITDDATLREYIPNVLTTVDNEEALFSKMSPQIDMAESWLANNITGQALLEQIAVGPRNELFATVAMVIATRAFIASIPSLDLVLTPNGFGIVSNNNIAPASKERIERLIASLTVTETRGLTMLLKKLRSNPDWHSSPQCQWLSESIIQDIDEMAKCGQINLSDCWSEFILLRQQAYPIEQDIANGWISPQLMERLRRCEATANYSQEERHLISLIKAVVCNAIHKRTLKPKLLDDAVSYIRAFPESFPEWHNSATAELFTPPIFENKKTSGGYFF